MSLAWLRLFIRVHSLRVYSRKLIVIIRYNLAMVAINLNLLGKQLQELREKFNDPESFRAGFHQFLSFYHQYSRRRHEDAMPKSFMRQYDLPMQIVPQLELFLRQDARKETEQSFALIDELWKDDYFEARDLACFILGQQPESETERVVEQIESWLSQAQDRAVVASIFEKGCLGLLEFAPNKFRDLTKKLLASRDARQQGHGLMALSIFLPKAQHNDLPSIYSMVRPFIARSDSRLQSRLSELVHELVKQSPGEMAYLLKEVLSDTEGTEIEQRLRSWLDFFEPEFARSIQTAIKNHIAQRVHRD